MAGEQSRCHTGGGLHLDKDAEHQALLSAALEDREDLELRVLDRTIAVRGSSKPQEAIQAGHERARVTRCSAPPQPVTRRRASPSAPSPRPPVKPRTPLSAALLGSRSDAEPRRNVLF